MWYVVRAAGCATIAMPGGEVRKTGDVSLRKGSQYLYWEDEGVLYPFTGYLHVRMKYCADEDKHVFYLPNLTVYMDCYTLKSVWVKIPYVSSLTGVLTLCPEVENGVLYDSSIRYARTKKAFTYLDTFVYDGSGVCGVVAVYDGKRFIHSCLGIELVCQGSGRCELGDVAFVVCRVGRNGVFTVIGIKKLNNPEYVLEDWENSDVMCRIIPRPQAFSDFGELLRKDVDSYTYDIEDIYSSIRGIVPRSVSDNIIDTLAWCACEYYNTR